MSKREVISERTPSASLHPWVTGLGLCLVMLSCATTRPVEQVTLDKLLSDSERAASCCDWEEAEGMLWQAIRSYPREIEPWLRFGKLCERRETFVEAVRVWDRIIGVRPRERDAILGRWRALTSWARHDPTRADSLRNLVVDEVTSWDSLRPRTQLSLELSYQGWKLQGEDSLAAATGGILSFRYPESDLAFEPMLDALYDSLSLVWTNAEKREAFLRRFLSRSPDSLFRAEAYAMLASLLASQESSNALKRLLLAWVRETPNDPRALSTAAYWFIEKKLNSYKALQYARKASDAVVHAQKPPGYPEERWSLFMREVRISSSISYARALLSRGDFETASRITQDVLMNRDDDVDSNTTMASAYYVLARCFQAWGKQSKTCEMLSRALVAGDSRNFWSNRADSLMRIVLRRLSVNQTPLEYSRWVLGFPGPRFTDVTELSGLAGVKADRVAWGDFDGDGWEDLLLGGERVFRNSRGERFVEVTKSLGLDGNAGAGGLWADVDNDGMTDLFVAGARGPSSDRLYLNRSEGMTMTESFPGDTLPTEGAAFCDFDRDGRLDLYLAKYESSGSRGQGLPDLLLRNSGRGLFVNESQNRGITTQGNMAGRGVCCSDFDGDGDSDILVSNYRLHPNFLWENDGGGFFHEAACQLGVKGTEDNGWWGHSIGSASGDFDNDGDMDLFTANLAHPRYIHLSDRSQLLENCSENGIVFKDVRRTMGIAYEETHSDPAWADVDNDGDLDLYLTSVYEGRRSFLYLNNGVSFEDGTYLAGVRVLNGWGCAFADYDGDNDLDLLVGSRNGVRLFRNSTSGHFLRVQPVGNGSTTNTSCVGCRVEIETPEGRQTREVTAGKGTTSQNSLVQHFGLGAYWGPVDLVIRFTDGEVRSIPGIAPDQFVIVYQ